MNSYLWQAKGHLLISFLQHKTLSVISVTHTVSSLHSLDFRNLTVIPFCHKGKERKASLLDCAKCSANR